MPGSTVKMMMENIKTEPLYIVLISVHGLIRSRDLELGRDADTGGQTKYVVELANVIGMTTCPCRTGLPAGGTARSAG
jgi:hypothetical protein